ncbi:MAG: RNA methyltransferase [Actinomycetia bacterium]|nr:RNA methyltransferase [Actinomycetes bacterium]
MTQPAPTSTKAERLRAIRRLANRSFRDQVGRFLIEGPQVVGEAIRHRPNAVSEVLLSDNATEPAAATAAAARDAGCTVTVVPEEVLVSVTETVTPQGIACICTYVDVPLDQVFPARPPAASEPSDQAAGAAHQRGSVVPRLTVLLDQVRDPGNAGTILRTAAAAGADAVLFGKNSVDPYNGKCVRSSAGAIFQTTICRDIPSQTAIEQARACHVRTLATDLRADHLLGSAETTALLGDSSLWIFGNEAHGLDPELAALADTCVRIPIFGPTESLNLAAAAAVSLYASAFAQH